MRILAKSERFQSAPRSIPAILVSTPNDTTIRQSTLIKFINDFFCDILFAHISVNDINPRRHVNANSPKHTDMSTDIAVLNAVPGVSSCTE